LVWTNGNESVIPNDNKSSSNASKVRKTIFFILGIFSLVLIFCEILIYLMKASHFNKKIFNFDHDVNVIFLHVKFKQ